MEEIMSNKGMGKMVVEKSGKCIFTISLLLFDTKWSFLKDCDLSSL